jgi:hypothetical protein
MRDETGDLRVGPSGRCEAFLMAGFNGCQLCEDGFSTGRAILSHVNPVVTPLGFRQSRCSVNLTIPVPLSYLLISLWAL